MATTLLALRRGSSVLRKIECTILNSSRTLRAQVIKQKTWTKIGVSGTFLFLFYNQLPMSFAEPAGDSSDAAPAGGDQGPKKNDPVEMFLEKYGAAFQRLGFGGVVGACTAVAVKKIGHEVAYVVGMGFVALQVLSYYGYISIDYNKVKESVKQKLDADGDGKLTTKDLVVYWNQFKDVLTYNVPGMGGFSAGFMLGLYF